MAEVGKQIFLKSPQSPIRKLLGSFRHRKSANFLVVPVRKSQICNFFISPQIINLQIFTNYYTTMSQKQSYALSL